MSTLALDELTALRSGAALCDHGQRFVVACGGTDALTWLERICSSPVKDMAAGDVVRATLMDGKGKLRADLRVLAPGQPSDGLLLDLPASHRAAILRVLDMYIIKEDVQLIDQSDERTLVSLLGPTADGVLAATGLLPEGQAPASVTSARPGLLLTPSLLGGVPGWDLIVDRAHLDALTRELTAGGTPSVSPAALDVVRIEHGVPWFGPDLAEGVIPLEALLDSSVSITKGCYPGQEVVARIQNLGHVSRKLVRLVAAGQVQAAAGTALLGTGAQDGKTVGVLTSLAFDPSAGCTRALGYVKRAAWTSGSTARAAGAEWTVESLAGD